MADSSHAAVVATLPALSAPQFLALHPADRISVVTATLLDAERRSPEQAVNEAIRFCAEDPSYSLEYGRALIATLAQSDHHRAALRFVLAQEADGWLGENGHKWLNTLFSTWARSAPAMAAEAAQRGVPAGLQGEAVQAVAAAWASTDPLSAANFASQLSAPAERDWTLRAVISRWADADPAAARAWQSRE